MIILFTSALAFKRSAKLKMNQKVCDFLVGLFFLAVTVAWCSLVAHCVIQILHLMFR